MLSPILRLVSIVICLIVLASFAIFAVQQMKSASTKQTESLGGSAPATTAPAAPTGHAPKPKRVGSVHKVIDEASGKLTSPFAGLVSSFSSEWASRIVKLLLALVLYGFGLGYLARVLRVRT